MWLLRFDIIVDTKKVYSPGLYFVCWMFLVADFRIQTFQLENNNPDRKIVKP